MTHLAVTRSIIASDALAEIMTADYEIDDEISCKLISKMLRTQDNDHYLTKAGANKYVARIYQLGQHLNRSKSDYQYEMDWLLFLHNKGHRVSYPIKRRDENYLRLVQAPEGLRYLALFSFARGKPMSFDDEEQLFSVGQKMAEMHLVSNEYEPAYDRQPMDLTYLVDEPLSRLKSFWDNKWDDRLDILVTSGEEAKEDILNLLNNEQSTTDSWGPIGGDFHPYNTHIDQQNSPSFFNFDLCGYGWRAYDIAVFLLNANLIKLSSRLSEAFFAGYYSVRPLSENEHQAIAPFLTIRRIWLTGMFATVEGVAGYTFIGPAQIDR